MAVDRARWNHNIHYHALVMAEIGPARRVLDVGCGEGGLARELRAVVPEVVAIDVDLPSLELARHQDPAGAIEFVAGDFLTHPFAPGSFDAVVSIAMLHHVEPVAALERMERLLRPGGTLVVIGCARSELPRDALLEAGSVGAHRFHLRTKELWQHPAPTVWPPAHTYREMREVAERTLPGARYRRRLLWRYSIVWRKPSERPG